MNTSRWTTAAAGLVLALTLNAQGQRPQDTTLTYQGRLTKAGAPLDDLADFRMSLWNAEQGGEPVGQTLEAISISVAEGLFTLDLDFGDVFDGQARWLQIDVRHPAGGGEFVTLEPRQPLTATPYASTALRTVGVDGNSLDSAGSGLVDMVMVDSAGQVSIGGTVTFGEPQVDQVCNCAVSAFAAGARYQSFTPDQSGRLTSVTVYLHNTHPLNPADVRLSIHEGGDTSGPVLGRVTRVVPRQYDGEFTYTFPNVAVRAGALYTWAISTSGLLLTYGDASDPYPGGRGDLGPTLDYHFATEVAAPEGVGSPAVQVTADGKVGIGTASPAEKLSVDGIVQSTSGGFKFPDGSVQTKSANPVWNKDGEDIFFSGGRVGIGSDDPRCRLQVDRLTTISEAEEQAFSRSFFGNNFYLDDNGSHYRIDNNLPGVVLGLYPASPAGRYYRFSRIEQDGSGPFDVAIIGDQVSYIMADKVGIRTTTPDATLHVNGETRTLALTVTANATIAGTTQTGILKITGGSDIAEPFRIRTADAGSNRDDAGAAIEPGMVVAIDPSGSGELRISDRAYDRTVAGIISGANGIQTGLTLRQEGTIADGDHPVALTGRVWCLCDADAGGAIAAGDLLTTSATAGHAMKAADPQRRSGATIGKAMTPLTAGKGLVLVLVSLQ